MTATEASVPSSFSRRRVWSTVLLLMLIGIFNVVDRLLPGLLIEPIKHDLHLSDTAIGLINGIGFLAVYSVLALPIARLSDRGAYGLVISSCLAVWSLMTMLGASAHTGWQFAVTRMGVALGEAGNTPAAHAFIARNFHPTARAAPLAVLALSVPISILIGSAGGSAMGQALGWRTTFTIVGVVGLLLSPLPLLAMGPRQALPPTTEPRSSSLKPAFQLFTKPSFLFTLAGAGGVACGGYALVAFAVAFLMRAHGLTIAQAGARYGLAAGVSGLVAMAITGVATDRLAARDPRWILGVLVGIIVLLAPFAYAALMVSNIGLVVIFLGFANVVASAYLVPVVAAIQRLAPPDQRATASAILFFFNSVFGSLGPLITGMISDALHPRYGAQTLAHALLVVPVSYVIAGALFALAALTFHRDIHDTPSRP